MPLPENHPLVDGRTVESAVVRAYRRERPATRPVWFMGQFDSDGPEALEASLNADFSSGSTLQAVHRHGADAAIFSTDILVPLLLAGVALKHPVRSASDVAALRPIDPESLGPIRDGVSQAVAELGTTPLVAVAGAPFTLASYLVEGGNSRDLLRARAMMFSDATSWANLLNWCADVTGEFLRAQVVAGASVALLADPRAGSLSETTYLRRVAPHSARAFSALRGLIVPKVHFGSGSAELLPAMHGTGADAIGVDWRIPLDEASSRLGGTVPLQGNLDPALLATPWRILEAHVMDVLNRGSAAPSHVVNLGAGMPPGADPGVLGRIVELVHEIG